jgi:hypothetical protein
VDNLGDTGVASGIVECFGGKYEGGTMMQIDLENPIIVEFGNFERRRTMRCYRLKREVMHR